MSKASVSVFTFILTSKVDLEVVWLVIWSGLCEFIQTWDWLAWEQSADKVWTDSNALSLTDSQAFVWDRLPALHISPVLALSLTISFLSPTQLYLPSQLPPPPLYLLLHGRIIQQAKPLSQVFLNDLNQSDNRFNNLNFLSQRKGEMRVQRSSQPTTSLKYLQLKHSLRWKTSIPSFISEQW